MINYQVNRGDTLYSISRRFDVTVDDILQANSMISDALKVDAVIKIPVSSSTESYVVQKGDTLFSISRRFDMDLRELMNLNGLNSSAILKEGDILKLTESSSLSLTQHQRESEKKEENSGNQDSQVVIMDVSHRSGDYVAPPQWPVAGEKSPFSGNIEGVIIQSTPGTTVKSVSPGRIVWTGPYREFGKVVLIDNGEYIFFYGGNREIFVNVGETVSAGASIGRLNYPQENSTASMFFTIFKEGRVVDINQVPRG